MNLALPVRSQTGKISDGDHVTLEHGKHFKYIMIAQQPHFDHITMGNAMTVVSARTGAFSGTVISSNSQ